MTTNEMRDRVHFVNTGDPMNEAEQYVHDHLPDLISQVFTQLLADMVNDGKLQTRDGSTLVDFNVAIMPIVMYVATLRVASLDGRIPVNAVKPMIDEVFRDVIANGQLIPPDHLQSVN